MKKTRRFWVTPPDKFIVKTLPDTMTTLNLIKYAGPASEMTPVYLRTALSPIYEYLTKVLQEKYSPELVESDLYGLYMEQNFATGETTLRVRVKEAGSEQAIAIELVDRFDQGDLISRCTLIEGGELLSMGEHMASREKVFTQI